MLFSHVQESRIILHPNVSDLPGLRLQLVHAVHSVVDQPNGGNEPSVPGIERPKKEANKRQSCWKSIIYNTYCMYCMLGKNIQTGSISSSGCPITSHPSQMQPTNAVICVATLLLNKTLQKAQPIQRLCAFTKIAVFKSCHNLVKFQLDQPKKSMDRFEVLCILSTCPTNI